MKRPFASALTAGVVLALAAAALAAPNPTGAAAVDARKANFKEIGGAFKAINDELKSGAPDMNAVRPAARDLASRAAQLPRLFPRGSGAESGAKTRAKADVWTDPASFQKLEAQFAAATNQLNAAATSGDIAALSAARTAVGAACKSCHDRFRQTE
jgi:cytochrome c556